MRQTFNTILHGFGAMFIMIGFCVFVGAGGNCDLNAAMTDIMPMLFKGMALLFGGLFLTWWRV